jgi:hypothetical protein
LNLDETLYPWIAFLITVAFAVSLPIKEKMNKKKEKAKNAPEKAETLFHSDNNGKKEK